MRKVLLFATALCLSSAAMAQTSIESALNAQKGENTYKVESSEAKNTYWKFTADKNYLAKGISIVWIKQCSYCIYIGRRNRFAHPGWCGLEVSF